MFCPECGMDCKDYQFCPKCGKELKSSVDVDESDSNANKAIPKLSEPYYVVISGQRVDIHQIVRTYGLGFRKIGAYSYLSSTYKLTKDEAKALLDPIYEAHAGEKISFSNSLASQISMEAKKQKETAEHVAQEREEKIEAAKASGKAYCPKCYSTDVTAQKKGFGFGKGALGLVAGVDVALLAGGINANKIILTCKRCGYQWKPGKK